MPGVLVTSRKKGKYILYGEIIYRQLRKKIIYDTINIIGGNVMAVITIRNVDENVNNALISMAKKRGLSREEFLRRHLEGLTLSGEVKEVEERYNSLILMLLGKLQDMENVIENNEIVMEHVLEVLRERDMEEI